MDKAALRAIARLVATTPRKPDHIVFLGRNNGQFIDNVKYAFLHCARYVSDLHTVFVGPDAKTCIDLCGVGLRAEHLGSQESLHSLLQAGVIVCDDFFWRDDQLLQALVSTAKVVQLWHGIPLKAIGFPEIASPVNMTPEKAKYLTEMYSGYDSVLSTSPYFTEHAFARAFKADAFPELGYPRNDVLFRPPNGPEMINVDYDVYSRMLKARKQGWKCVMFMPTFRDVGGGPLEEGKLDLVRMDKFNRRHKALTVCKLHPYVPDEFVKNLPPTIFIADSGSDAYPLLGIADVLLTDYSSVYFDFLLTNRPVVFYPYDLERYISINRTLLFDYQSMTPGFHARTPDELFNALETLLVHGDDPHKGEREALAAKAFTHRDGNATTRLGNYLVERFVNS